MSEAAKHPIEAPPQGGYDVEFPPSGDELPYDDGEPLETLKHGIQADLLIHVLNYHWMDRNDFFVAGNMFLYFSALQAKRNDFRGPDVFVVMDTERRERKSWVVWEEERAPDLIVELTSPSTEREDYDRKKQVYGQTLRVPEYIIFDPHSGRLDAFRLDTAVRRYHDSGRNEHGHVPSEALGLALGLWEGTYQAITGVWLRWYSRDGALLPTPEEVAARETERAEREAERAEREAERAEREAERAEREAERRTAAEQRVVELERRIRDMESK